MRAAWFVAGAAWLAACGADSSPASVSSSSSGGAAATADASASSSSSSSGAPPADAAALDAAAPRKLQWGVNGHELRPSYPLTQSEAVFQLLAQSHLTRYRVDVQAQNLDVLDTLVPLGRTYGVTIRPMLYPTDQASAYAFAKRYAADIPVWEIGNEQDFDHAGAQARIDAMVATARGVEQAAAETGVPLRTSINVMACNSDDPDGRCPGDPNGDMWFVDQAKASGFDFDYLTFHYYPSQGDNGYWFDKYLGQMRAISTKYGVHVFVNETNCGEVYHGGHAGDGACYDGLAEFFAEIRTHYADIVDEVDLYELLDEPNNDGVERHFGALYDLQTPKPIFTLLQQNAAL